MSKRKLSSDKPGLFTGKTFVFSKAERSQDVRRLSHLIVNGGGVVKKSLSAKRKPDFFVQSYNTDDDGRLHEAKENSVQVVCPAYVEHCVAAGELVPFYDHAFLHADLDNTLPEGLGTPGSLGHSEHMYPVIPDYAREDEELPQTFGEFLNMEDRNILSKGSVMYIAPLHRNNRTLAGSLPGSPLMELRKVCRFMSAFFGVPVKEFPGFKVLPRNGSTVITYDASGYEWDVSTYNGSLYAMDIIDILIHSMPKDACCMMMLSDISIYEVEDDSILYGRATGDGCGVVSTQPFTPEGSGSNASRDWLRQVCKTLAHEALHTFGLDHCVFRTCIMNACLGDGGADEEPADVCPVDARKLLAAAESLNCIRRWESMRKLYGALGWSQEEAWVDRRMKAAKDFDGSRGTST